MNMASKVRQKLSIIEGQVCQTTRFAASNILILYIGAPIAQKSMLTDWRVWIETAWRLRRGQTMLAGYCDSDSAILESLRFIHGRKIRAIHFDARTRDLTVDLTGGYVIECFVHGIANPQWELRFSTGYRIGVYKNLEIKEEWSNADRIPPGLKKR